MSINQRSGKDNHSKRGTQINIQILFSMTHLNAEEMITWRLILTQKKPGKKVQVFSNTAKKPGC
jgi:hypothetical protein